MEFGESLSKNVVSPWTLAVPIVDSCKMLAHLHVSANNHNVWFLVIRSCVSKSEGKSNRQCGQLENRSMVGTCLNFPVNIVSGHLVRMGGVGVKVLHPPSHPFCPGWTVEVWHTSKWGQDPLLHTRSVILKGTDKRSILGHIMGKYVCLFRKG